MPSLSLDKVWSWSAGEQSICRLVGGRGAETPTVEDASVTFSDRSPVARARAEVCRNGGVMLYMKEEGEGSVL